MITYVSIGNPPSSICNRVKTFRMIPVPGPRPVAFPVPTVGGAGGRGGTTRSATMPWPQGLLAIGFVPCVSGVTVADARHPGRAGRDGKRPRADRSRRTRYPRPAPAHPAPALKTAPRRRERPERTAAHAHKEIRPWRPAVAISPLRRPQHRTPGGVGR